MDSVTYNLRSEPDKDLYQKIVRFASAQGFTAILVVRKENALDDSGHRILQLLSPSIHTVNEQSEWPGTTLIDSLATVYHFSLDTTSLNVIESNTHRLFQWIQPDLPEDFCIFNTSGLPWLTTSAHESDGYFILNSQEYQQLISYIPDLVPSLLRNGDH